MSALCNGTQCLPEIKSICLANNRLTERGAISIIPGLNKNLLVLDLANNQLGKVGCQVI
jgi:hypothetical protein